MAALAPPVARSTARSGATAMRAAAKRDDPKQPKPRAKMKVSQPSDPLEREADRAADRVMRKTAAFPMAGPQEEEKPVRRAADKKPNDRAKRASKPKDDKAAKRTGKPKEEPKRATNDKDKQTKRAAKPKEEPKRATKPKEEPKRATKSKDDKAKRDAAPDHGAGSADGGVPGGFESALGQVRQGGGEMLSGGTRQEMESGFGQDFGNVRVHRDSGAANLSDSIDARAFTLGQDVFFAPGQYQPHTPDGRRLIAHELAHVVQDNGGRAAQPMLWRQPNGAQTPPAPPAGTPPAGGEAAPTGPPTFEGTDGKRIVKEPASGKKGTMTLPTLQLPTVLGDVKGASNHKNAAIQGKPGAQKMPIVTGQEFDFLGRTARGSKSARRTWIDAALGNAAFRDSLTQAVRQKFGGGGGGAGAPEGTAGGGEDGPTAPPAPLAQGEAASLYLRPFGRGPTFFILGTAEEVAAHELVVLPVWDKAKERHEYDVDHLMELQVGGLDGWENFWVLDASANRSSGSKINSALTKDVGALINEAPTGQFWGAGPGGPKPTVEEALTNWKIHFNGFRDLSISGDKGNYWTRDEVQRGDHLAGLKAMTEREIANAGLKFKPGDRPTFINVFSGPQAGFFKRLNRKGSSDEWKAAGSAAGFYRGFDLTGIQIDPFDAIVDGRDIGRITGRAFTKASKENKLFTPPEFEMKLKQSTRLGFGVYVDRQPLNDALAALREFKKTSPVQIEDGGLSADGTLFVEGRIIASIPLFQGVEIPFSITGDQITLEFPIPTDRLRLGPVEITDAGIEISVGASGLELGGGINFTVRGIGSGRLEAQVGAAAPRPAPAAAPGAAAAPAEGTPAEPGFSFTGSFNFDSDKLDPATVTVAYSNHQFSVDATVGLAAGAVSGLESAQIHLFSGPEGIAADGEAVLGVPPLQGTRLIVRRAVDGSIEIAAENIPLPVGGIPGVTGATASIRVSRNPDTGEWRLSGGGSATIAVAGVSGVLSADVNGPFLTIAGQNLVISRPPLQGSGWFRVTNQPMDEAGNPIEGEPGPMAATGHAEASMPLGSFLTATIGGTFLPNGELQFTGSVSLPPTVDLFERREFNRVLFEPPSLDIPLLGVSAAGQRIGIFATIGGSLSFIAGIGPGQLRNAALTATFNPDRPQDTTVEGQAQFFIPADAGLQLAIHGGIGVGIPIVSAEAGIEVTGALGITGEAAADVGVRWTPQEGLSAEATAHLAARPQFTFGINAYVEISADVVITEFELYSERWNLASYTFGPQLEVGVDIPVRWSELAGLDFDVNQIEVRRPDIDFQQLGSDLMGALIG